MRLVKLDATLDFPGDGARAIESLGLDGAWASEIGHDPLLTLAGAARASSSLTLGTSVLVAFGRSPMNTAMLANDVQELSGGRLVLGLGSQVRAHIERRYAMPWSQPAARMREYVAALRAIWANWSDDRPLNFRGEFYRLTLMPPFFRPAPHSFGAPRVFVAAVGPAMTEVAGEVADGLLVHPFTTARYLDEVTRPALERGFARRERERADFEVSLSALVGVGEGESAARAVRDQVAFYASTPAYRGVLEVAGLGDLGDALGRHAVRGRWGEMGRLVPDDFLEQVATVGPATSVADDLLARWGSRVDRLGVSDPGGDPAAAWEVLAALVARRGPAAPTPTRQ